MEPEPDLANSTTALIGRLRTVVLERGYVRRTEPFQLSSGGLSFDYVDLRRALSRGEDLALAADALSSRLDELRVSFEALGGMTMGADPLAHAVAVRSGTSWFSVRKEEKRHGAGRRIEGAEVGQGTRVVLLEDTVSTGRSALDALAVLRQVGADVVLCCTVLDRGETARRAFCDAGVEYTSLLTYRDLGIEPVGPASATSS